MLLKGLGIAPDDLAILEDSLDQLRGLFNSLLQERHLRTIAAIFGKSLPLDFGADGTAEAIAMA